METFIIWEVIEKQLNSSLMFEFCLHYEKCDAFLKLILKPSINSIENLPLPRIEMISKLNYLNQVVQEQTHTICINNVICAFS